MKDFGESGVLADVHQPDEAAHTAARSQIDAKPKPVAPSRAQTNLNKALAGCVMLFVMATPVIAATGPPAAPPTAAPTVAPTVPTMAGADKSQAGVAETPGPMTPTETYNLEVRKANYDLADSFKWVALIIVAMLLFRDALAYLLTQRLFKVTVGTFATVEVNNVNAAAAASPPAAQAALAATQTITTTAEAMPGSSKGLTPFNLLARSTSVDAAQQATVVDANATLDAYFQKIVDTILLSQLHFLRAVVINGQRLSQAQAAYAVAQGAGLRLSFEAWANYLVAFKLVERSPDSFDALPLGHFFVGWYDRKGYTDTMLAQSGRGV